MRQRQLELERQRRLEEEKKKKQLAQSIRKEETKLRAQEEAVTRSLNQLIQEVEANQLKDGLLYSKLMSQKEKADAKIRDFSRAYDKNSIPQMEAQLEALKKFQGNLKSEDQAKLKELIKQFDDELVLKKDFEKRQQVLSDLSEATVSERKTYHIPTIPKVEEETQETIDIQAEVEMAYEKLEPFLQDKSTYFIHDVEHLYDSIRSLRAMKPTTVNTKNHKSIYG